MARNIVSVLPLLLFGLVFLWRIEERLTAAAAARIYLLPIKRFVRSVQVPYRAASYYPDDNNKWCTMSSECESDGFETCGYDPGEQFGKFKDVCHMITYNCYFNHDYVPIATCS